MSYCCYLMSSLPILLFKRESHYSSSKLVDISKNILGENEFKEFKKLSLIPPTDSNSYSNFSVINKWYCFETKLRDVIVKIRNENHSLLYLMSSDNNYNLEGEINKTELNNLIQRINNISDPFERENIIDEYRWNWLDRQEFINKLNFNSLCIYKIRIMICEKWYKRIKKEGNKNLDLLLNKLMNNTFDKTV
jgi:hypothetical protein